MGIHDRVSTGVAGLDRMIDHLRIGDNVVWIMDSLSSYKNMAQEFVRTAVGNGRKVVYVRFGAHEPLLNADQPIEMYEVKAGRGFETFTAEIYHLIGLLGRRTFYVFDCLTELLTYWHSDVMVKNFFKIVCPFLYELDTVAYFGLKRNVHTLGTIAGIRETTQVLLDLFQSGENVYIHPLKVYNRYSPTMFLPHLLKDQEAVSITSSVEAASLFAGFVRKTTRQDYWDSLFAEAEKALVLPAREQNHIKRRLIMMLMGNQSRMIELCEKYFTLQDVLGIASREIGTGFIGGKSVGMLLARKALETEDAAAFSGYMEAHDSFYIGSDVFYTYIVQNDWWKLRTKQKTKEGYYIYAKELKEKLLTGQFPEEIQSEFMRMLDYFGQSPIIVRSSSLLEDNFGNAFSGKYESVFCVNQGTPEERYEAFENAVRTVYASTMSEDALAYRMSRGLFETDEQMAILVQRVSGDYYGPYFFPHVAGVGNSKNLYVWDKQIDMEAGMLRLVFGLGTRAVDRTSGDHVRIVSLDDPLRRSPMDSTDQKKFTQKDGDVLSLSENSLTQKKLEELLSLDIKTDKNMFFRPDIESMKRLRALGYAEAPPSYILDFNIMLSKTGFAPLMRNMLKTLEKVYDYPVDIEFTANFSSDGFKVNLLQCRPLQTRGLGKAVEIPKVMDEKDCFFQTHGNFMGGNIRLALDYVVMVDTKAYLALSEQDKHLIARQIGKINAALHDKNVMLLGPGRWGTTTSSIGVPVHFAEICNMSVICEVADEELGYMPELSYGSHFFQDLVEMQIFYVAVFAGEKGVIFNSGYFSGKSNLLHEVSPYSRDLSGIISVYDTKGLQIYSDVMTQIVLCR